MQYVTTMDYAKLRAASLFCDGQGRTLATSGIHINRGGENLQASNGLALIEIPVPGLLNLIRKSTIIKPQGAFGRACQYVKLYQDGHDKTFGFMRGYTASGTPIQQAGFDRLISVVYIDGNYPSAEKMRSAVLSQPVRPQSEISMDADLVSRVGRAVKLLTNGVTTQVRMRFYGSPANIIISDTRKQYCSVFLNAVKVN